MAAILFVVAALALIFWIVGMGAHLLGTAIYVFLIVAIVLGIAGLLTGRSVA